jgi:hypothetical protein
MRADAHELLHACAATDYGVVPIVQCPPSMALLDMMM